MWEPKGECRYSQCLFERREHFSHETVAHKNISMRVMLISSAFSQNAIMKSVMTGNASFTSQIFTGTQKTTYLFRFLSDPSADQPQRIDKTSQTAFVDLVEVVLSAYHQ